MRTSPLQGSIERLENENKILKRKLYQADRFAELTHQLSVCRTKQVGTPSFDDLSLPLLDKYRLPIDKEDADLSKLDDDQMFFRENGYLIKNNLLPPDILDPYFEERRNIEDPDFSVWGGSYMLSEKMREVCLDHRILDVLEKLIGKPTGLFLTLSGLQTTRREWHQDFYLKPAHQNVEYVAVWIALDDVPSNSGLFELIAGSHKWPVMRRELVWDWLESEQRDTPGWPRFAEKIVTEACKRRIAEERSPVERFEAKKGDVLFWHSCLLHQGAQAERRGIMRPSLVAHYASLDQLKLQGKPLAPHTPRGSYVVRDDQDRTLRARKQEKHGDL